MSNQPHTAPDLLYSDVESELRSSIRDLLTDRCPPETLPPRVQRERPYADELWRTLAAELGVAGLGVPEERGGQGGSARELAVVAEELGHNPAPVPFLGSTVLATKALLGIDAPGTEAADLLRALASGARTAALAVTLSTMPGSDFPSGVRAEGDGTLHGSVSTVADASAADTLVVPVRDTDGPALYAVGTDASEVSVADAVALDLTRPVADVSLHSATGTRLAGPGEAEAAWEHALTAGAALLAAEQVGLSQWCLDETVRYTRERHQFGRPVGSFQALKHRLADVYLEIVSARAAARDAADTLAAAAPDLPVAAAVAQSYCAETAVHAAEESLQLHGGIGMTWEHPAHLYLKRAKADELALGTPGAHRARLATLVELPA